MGPLPCRKEKSVITETSTPRYSRTVLDQDTLCHDRGMDAQTIDQEYEKLQAEFQDVAQSVAALAAKLQAAGKAGDANAAGWFNDLELIAKDIDDEQTQAKVLLLTIHGFITTLGQTQTQAPPVVTSTAADQKPPLFAPGYEPQQNQPQQQGSQHHGLFSGMMGGYGGGGFAQAMEMGAGMSLGADLVSSIFR